MMSCTISDRVGSLSSTLTFVPFFNAPIVASAAASPLFVVINAITQSLMSPIFSTVYTDLTGSWSIKLPWPSECNPTTKWSLFMPDGIIWSGVVPEGLTGSLTLLELSQSYGWTAR